MQDSTLASGQGLAVLAQAPQFQRGAEALAARLGLNLLDPGSDAKNCDTAAALLLLGPQGLDLQLTGARAPGPVRVDFGAARMRHRRGAGHNELLGRAVGVGKKRPLNVIDATAGLGRDSFVLADLGADVLLCEQHPVIAAMLESGLQRAAASEDPWLRETVSRMRLFPAEASTLPAQRLDAADVIYLDPMFPRRDKQAAVKKEMALFQLLLGEGGSGADELLCWALDQSVARVVVKRPRKAGALAGRKPSHQLGGKAVRFDVYTLVSFTR